jgi:hypothetical protein
MADNEEPRAAAGGAGLGGTDPCDGISLRDSHQASGRQLVDPRLALLARAGAKLDLIEACLESLDRAFADIEHAVHSISPCACEREMVARLEQLEREWRLADWRRWPSTKPNGGK